LARVRKRYRRSTTPRPLGFRSGSAAGRDPLRALGPRVLSVQAGAQSARRPPCGRRRSSGDMPGSATTNEQRAGAACVDDQGAPRAAQHDALGQVPGHQAERRREVSRASPRPGPKATPRLAGPRVARGECSELAVRATFAIGTPSGVDHRATRTPGICARGSRTSFKPAPLRSGAPEPCAARARAQFLRRRAVGGRRGPQGGRAHFSGAISTLPNDRLRGSTSATPGPVRGGGRSSGCVARSRARRARCVRRSRRVGPCTSAVAPRS
jgi:hypothetical protein